MSATTLVKPRPGGAQEAERPVAEPPEKLHPARATLATKLAELEKALSDLADYEAKSARAERDEQQALDNAKLSESEAADAISRAQSLKAVYKSRTANRQQVIAALSKEVSEALRLANGELTQLVNAERERREVIFGDRVVAALEVGNAVNPSRLKYELAGVLQFCGPIQLIQALAPSTGIVTPGNAEGLVSIARDTLGKFERVIAESGRKL
jgi:hypothetical protein